MMNTKIIVVEAKKYQFISKMTKSKHFLDFQKVGSVGSTTACRFDNKVQTLTSYNLINSPFKWQISMNKFITTTHVNKCVWAWCHDSFEGLEGSQSFPSSFLLRGQLIPKNSSASFP